LDLLQAQGRQASASEDEMRQLVLRHRIALI